MHVKMSGCTIRLANFETMKKYIRNINYIFISYVDGYISNLIFFVIKK